MVGFSVCMIQCIENGECLGLEIFSVFVVVFEVMVVEIGGEVWWEDVLGQEVLLDLCIEEVKVWVYQESCFFCLLLVVLVVCVLLVVFNCFINLQYYWFGWVVLIWGVLLVVRGLCLFVFGEWIKNWCQVCLQWLLCKQVVNWWCDCCWYGQMVIIVCMLLFFILLFLFCWMMVLCDIIRQWFVSLVVKLQNCFISRIVMFLWFVSWWIILLIFLMIEGWIFLVGLLRISSCGWLVSVWLIVSCCCWLLDKLLFCCCFMVLSIGKSWQIFFGICCVLWVGKCDSFISRFFFIVRCGNILCFWGMQVILVCICWCGL